MKGKTISGPRWYSVILIAVTLLAAMAIVSCQGSKCSVRRTESEIQPVVSQVEHPDWSRNLSIYEVNVRQYSADGDFKGFESHLPRLREMGVGILWFMPIHPIGEEKRKGTLGSYYSVKDYYGVNPEFGTLDEFKALVDRIHGMGMYVIIDWVANHSAWDNPLTIEHPDWFMRDSRGNFFPPVPDWSDVIDLDFNSPELRDYMIAAMRHWVEEVDVDGFRCDVAGMVPIDFWNRAREELEQVKPVFLLAEAEEPRLHRQAFDMSYGWRVYHLMNAIAKGTKTSADIDAHLYQEARLYPRSAYRMYFTSNHDENSWNGTVFERLGESAEVFAVLASTLEGMPLVYSGQEAGLDHRLEFFEKDLIEWREHEFGELYSVLQNLKKENRALWNGEWGGPLIRVRTSEDNAIFAFVREKGEDKVFAALNLSGEMHTFRLEGTVFVGNYRDLFSGQAVALAKKERLILGPWQYRVLVQ
jgi:glycosidase